MGKQNKRLSLDIELIRELTDSDMRIVNGGAAIQLSGAHSQQCGNGIQLSGAHSQQCGNLAANPIQLSGAHSQQCSK